MCAVSLFSDGKAKALKALQKDGKGCFLRQKGRRGEVRGQRAWVCLSGSWLDLDLKVKGRILFGLRSIGRI